MNEVDRLRKALQQWKCPSCGGTGTYQQLGRHQKEGKRKAPEGKWPDRVICKKCNGTGLHPVADEALRCSLPLPLL